jgi:hypothetical protein
VAVTTSGKEQRLSDYLRSMTFKLTPAEVKMVSFGCFCFCFCFCFSLLTFYPLMRIDFADFRA